jgi:hypothetical protein
METYGYGSEGFDDSGWGCVYRSVQNAQSYLGLPVTPIKDLLSILGHKRGDWSEPAQYLYHGLFPGARSLGILVGQHNVRWLQQTDAKQYGMHIDDGRTLEEVLSMMNPRGKSAFVIDDGVSGFAVVPDPRFPGQPGHLLFIDPHFTPARVYSPLPSELFNSRKGWMVLCISRR